MSTQVRGLLAIDPADDETLSVLGEKIRVLVSSRATAGVYAVTEEIAPPGADIPLHVHEHTDEIFHILDGELEMVCGGERETVGPDQLAPLPRGLAHSFRNVSDEPCRFTVTITPGGWERFFEEIGAATAAGKLDNAVFRECSDRSDVIWRVPLPDLG